MQKSIDINWEILGAQLANLDDGVQADFFKGFTNEMATWNTRAQAEMQCIRINEQLTEKQRDLIRAIGLEESA